MCPVESEIQVEQSHEPTVEPPLRTGWQGAATLRYDCPDLKTRLISSWNQAPLKVQRPFYPESGACHTVLIHTAGGMVGGDRLVYDIALASNAHVVLTTAAASKIYRTLAQGAEQAITLDIAEDAYLEWLPQETILFNQAHFKQTLRVNLALGARWLGWDVYRFGRTARGERFLEGHWRSHTEVWQSGIPLWIDRQWLPGGQHTLDHPHGLGGYPVVGTLVWVGQSVEKDLVQKLRSRWAGDRLGEVGVTRIQQGVVCRYRGPSTHDVREWFTQVWNDVRFYALGQPACPSRVWQL
jgi:urease accessory protein